MAALKFSKNVLVLKNIKTQQNLHFYLGNNAVNLFNSACYSSITSPDRKAVPDKAVQAREKGSCVAMKKKTWSKLEAVSTIKIDGPGLAHKFDPNLVEELTQGMDGDMPVTEMPDPFEKEYHRCFLCRQNVVPDHKNVRLLSQFVSPYTGRIYDRAITGLCMPMHERITKLIRRSRMAGFMPYLIKDPKYLQDPQPYDPVAKKYV